MTTKKSPAKKATQRAKQGSLALGDAPRSPAKKSETKPTRRASEKPARSRSLNAQERAARTTPTLRERAKEIGAILAKAIPEARCELEFNNPFELLISTILASQFTDRGVNALAPTLYAKYPTPAALAAASQLELEAMVKQTGYFKQKAKYLRETSKKIIEQHNGEVPRTMEALLEFPGVARKTANVVLGTAFRIPSGVVVDTHGIRVSERLGLLGVKPRPVDRAPEQIEIRLMALFPKDEWIDIGHRLTLHGRYTCTAYDRKCGQCPLTALCPSVREDA